MEGLTAHELDLRAVLEGQRRASFITALTDIAVYYETHPDAPIPDCTTLGYHTQGDGDEERAAFVDAIAEAHGVHTRTLPDGTYMASREFGPFKVEAHTTPAAARQQATRQALYGKPVAA